MAPDEPARRLFLALWPDIRARAALAALQRRIGRDCGGRPVAVENLHVTLKFLGAVPLSDMETVRAVAARESLAPVDLVLDRVGFWPHPAVVFVGADQVPESVNRLARRLDEAFADLGYARERRRFRAHCTLFRRAGRRPSLAFEPIVWPVDGLTLAESEPTVAGAHYRVLERWAARRPAPP